MSINEPAYAKALEKTKNILGESGEGFVAGNASITTLTKQNNLTIELLLTLHGKIKSLEDKIQDLKEDLTKKADKPSSSGLDKQLDDLAKRIEGLRTGAAPVKVVERGKLKVHANPFELLRKIQ
ncbi:ORF2 [Sugarcane bacilliform MO virus]|uniref:ORF2 n=1 Tax=Sugarcane bacilliform MO virus TaxID=362399 RepID=Q86997_9VIRU|nr:ORF2 [Sugarcane bacilliform MO virus]AAA47453.1 ORF2 [Sugarcane bacilliform MO virus]